MRHLTLTALTGFLALGLLTGCTGGTTSPTPTPTAPSASASRSINPNQPTETVTPPAPSVTVSPGTTITPPAPTGTTSATPAGTTLLHLTYTGGARKLAGTFTTPTTGYTITYTCAANIKNPGVYYSAQQTKTSDGGNLACDGGTHTITPVGGIGSGQSTLLRIDGNLAKVSRIDFRVKTR